jgi:decaprenylphospho-beta-D-ribofuranose 2-oxidase
VAEAVAALADADDTGILAHGAGTSYGDVAINPGGRVLLTRRLNRLLAFDPATGEVVAEAGVTIRDLLRVFLPRGFLIPVSPGTAFVTLGGAVANDVHGKNHEGAGSFCTHVRWLDLLLPSGEIVRTGPDQRPELFQATAGGVGLTGVILAVCLRLKPVSSNGVVVTERRIPDMDGFLAALEQVEVGAYSVGWIDALSGGGALGRGVLQVGRPATGPVPVPPRRDRSLPVDLPGFVLNPLTVAAFNALYWRRVPAAGRERVLAYETFSYPLDAILQWNRLYGAAGFHQFQCVVPAAGGPAALRRLLEETSRARAASFLAVLKRLGDGRAGFLSFPRAGYTLAMDFPHRAGTLALLARLERVVREHGGRVYLAKDSALSPEGFAEMYPEADRFRAVLAEVDPAGRMTSALARRLKLRRAA